MTERKPDNGLDFEAFRLGIEQCEPDVIVGYYAENAELRILNADAPENAPFELRGKVEITKHLRAVFGQEASHRVELGVVGEEQVTFREACEYPDGSRVWVKTMLEVHNGKIVRQVEVVSAVARANREEEISRGPPTRQTQTRTHPGADAPAPDRLLRSEQTTEKEEL